MQIQSRCRFILYFVLHWNHMFCTLAMCLQHASVLASVWQLISVNMHLSLMSAKPLIKVNVPQLPPTWLKVCVAKAPPSERPWQGLSCLWLRVSLVHLSPLDSVMCEVTKWRHRIWICLPAHTREIQESGKSTAI